PTSQPMARAASAAVLVPWENLLISSETPKPVAASSNRSMALGTGAFRPAKLGGHFRREILQEPPGSLHGLLEAEAAGQREDSGARGLGPLLPAQHDCRKPKFLGH